MMLLVEKHHIASVGALLIIVLKLVSPQDISIEGLLYPRESETREVLSLDGMWNFAKSNPLKATEGLEDAWFVKNLEESVVVNQVPVPSSFNDFDTDDATRDHTGTVWYERKFFVPSSWQSLRVILRFGSVHYEANVWINGEHVLQHTFGHLPFEAEITKNLNFGQENRITVLCDNTLTASTIPQGHTSQLIGDDGIVSAQQYNFDFFNYAGVHRSVQLYTTPVAAYIKEVNILDTTVDDDGRGNVAFEIIPSDISAVNSANVFIYDKQMNLVASVTDGGMHGLAIINNVRKWWPYLMDSDPGYMYTIEVKLSTGTEDDIDIYRMKFGVRTLKWTNKQFLINDKPIYFRGLGVHEDSDYRGRGFDLATVTRDFALLRWIGANSYRTTHYPHSEESMQFADEHGIMIIDECGLVQANINTEIYYELLQNHKANMEQLIHRDRNHPSVIMWSISNEPMPGQTGADDYFNEVTTYTRQLDKSRPLTASISTNLDQDELAKYLDIVSFNRFNAWNSNTGRLDMIISNVVNEARQWHERHSKPVIMSEYGAETVEGLHLSPAFVFSEEYQTKLLSKHFQAFDKLRSEDFFIGEFVYNYADFNTKQSINRVGSNKKGIFTRNRQPKTAAHLLRKRYFDLAAEIDNFTDRPKTLYPYISQYRRPPTWRGILID